MRKLLLLPLALLIAISGLSAGTEHARLLRPSDVKSLSKMFANYFRARKDDNIKKMVKSFKTLEKKLATTAKSKKVTTLMVSPDDLRTVYGAPISPERNLHKGSFYKQSFTVSLPEREIEYEYLLSLPKDYNHGTAVSTVLCLHPQIDRLDELKKWAVKAYPPEISSIAAIVIPINVGAKRVDWDALEGRYRAFFTIREMSFKYNIDRLAIFLDSHLGTALAATNYATGYPGMFTALICRNLSSVPPGDLLANARNIQFLFLSPPSGDGAQLVSAFADEARGKGVDVKVVKTAAAPDGGGPQQGIAALADLIANTRKSTSPERIQFTTNSAEYVNAYWLHLLQMEVSPDKPVSVEASVDRTSNEIHVTTPPGVKSFRVYLNDDLLDMGKSIKLIHTIVNDDASETTVRFEGVKSRSFEKSLNIWFNNLSGNFGEVYTSYIEVEIP